MWPSFLQNDSSRVDPHSPTMLLPNQEKSGMVSEGLHEDLKLKYRIRILKFVSRILSFLCSVTVITLSSISFGIFLSTRSLPPIGNSIAWPENTILWPYILVLAVACVSFIASSIILISYCTGGHRRAEKTSIWGTVAAVLGFVIAIVVWAVTGGSMQATKDVKTGKDLWGWACAKETAGQKIRRARYADKVDYDLVCRLQDWNFICTMIHIAAELFTIVVYVFAGWRIYRRIKSQKAGNRGY